MNQGKSEINDKRIDKEFRGISFSKYKKTEVKKQLLQCLVQGKLEDSCYWSAELICAGHYLDLWEIIINCTAKHIHIGNPKLPIYVEMRMDAFKEIVNNGYIDNEIKMRNNPKIRELFVELICILCFSRKMHSFNQLKINKDDFNISNLGFRLKAKHVDYAKPIFMKEDPKELFVAINELAFCVSKDSLNTHNACYWMEWILEYEKLCKSKKEKCKCERRVFAPVESKLQMDIVWIIWEIILHESTKRSKIAQKVLQSILNLFSIKFTANSKRKRIHLLYFAINVLTMDCNYKVPIIENKVLIENIVKKIDSIYMLVKKNEVKPDTDYLYHGLDSKSNLDKTLHKLDIMNNMGFIPRE
jgi:hypothetical protein